MMSIHLFVMLSLDSYFEGPNHEGEKIAKGASSSLESHHVNVIAVNPGGPTIPDANCREVREDPTHRERALMQCFFESHHAISRGGQGRLPEQINGFCQAELQAANESGG